MVVLDDLTNPRDVEGCVAAVFAKSNALQLPLSVDHHGKSNEGHEENQEENQKDVPCVRKCFSLAAPGPA